MERMTQSARIDTVIFDAADIDALASFYTALTGWQEVDHQSDWITIRADDGQQVSFQLAPDHVPPQWPGQEHPQQFHLDLFVADPEVAATRAVELGATQLAAAPTFVTLADPAGHPFDLCRGEVAESTDVGLYSVAIDVPAGAAEKVAQFYGDLLGMSISYNGPEGAMLDGEGRHLMFQHVQDEYNPPRWPDPAHPQQAHLDISVDDLDAGQERVLELGATSLNAGGSTFRVFADPVGHPFCLVA
jgi:predicted enzyme related to lactoylglutathione lyase